MGEHQDVLDELRDPARSLRDAIPEVFRGFQQLSAAATHTDGALPARTKELIALAVSVAVQCDGCIAHHARAAVRTGAQPGEVAEALGVAISMRGGPAVTYGPRAWAAYHEFSAAVDPDRGADGQR